MAEAVITALREAERVAQDERRRRQPAAAAATEGDLDPHARVAAAGGQAQRLGQQRLVDPAGRQRQPPRVGVQLDVQRLLLDHRALTDFALELRSGAADPDPGQRAGAEQHQRGARDVQRLRVERTGDRQQ